MLVRVIHGKVARYFFSRRAVDQMNIPAAAVKILHVTRRSDDRLLVSEDRFAAQGDPNHVVRSTQTAGPEKAGGATERETAVASVKRGNGARNCIDAVSF